MYKHISVLQEEVIEWLKPQADQNFVDGTLGGGGHTEAILKKNGQGKVIAFELDERAITASKKKLSKYKDRLIVVNRSYVHLKEELKKYSLKISGIVLDLGLSSDQLDKTNRGFSFKDDGPLDMRFDTKSKLTATDIILTWPEDKLIKIFREYGEFSQASRLAKGIILWRNTLDKQKQNCLRTSMLVGVILRILNIKPETLGRYRIHPATKIFQALRIAVNQELDNLKKVLPQAIEALSLGGRLAVISFHSLEDRIVKEYFKELARECICPTQSPVCNCNHRALIKILTKAIKPSSAEVKRNPRSRSAILRVVEKIY